MSARTFSVIRSATGAIALLLLTPSVRAGFILDEFTDPVETVAPEMIDERVSTFDVGPTAAERRIAITATLTNPTGSLRIPKDDPGTLVGELFELNPRPNTTNSKFWGTEVKYMYDSSDPIDLTEGGQNDAFFIDFSRFQADVLPRFTRIIIFGRGGDGGGGWDSFLPTIPQQDEPFTLVFPFSSFNTRGGVGGTPNFTQVHEIDWDISFRSRSNDSQIDLGFAMEVERIRVGKIPEPSSVVMLLLAVIPAVRLA